MTKEVLIFSQLNEEVLYHYKINNEYNILIEKLKKISCLKPGQTISSSREIITNHNYISGLLRRYYDDDRYKTIEWIKNVLNDVNMLRGLIESIQFEFIQDFETQKRLMVNNLIEMKLKAVEGLKNLRYTYKDDEIIQKKLDKIFTSTWL